MVHQLVDFLHQLEDFIRLVIFKIKWNTYLQYNDSIWSFKSYKYSRNNSKSYDRFYYKRTEFTFVHLMSYRSYTVTL